jgi:hypothetical protein
MDGERRGGRIPSARRILQPRPGARVDEPAEPQEHVVHADQQQDGVDLGVLRQELLHLELVMEADVPRIACVADPDAARAQRLVQAILEQVGPRLGVVQVVADGGAPADREQVVLGLPRQGIAAKARGVDGEAGGPGDPGDPGMRDAR